VSSWGSPVGADHIGAVEVGEHEDVEQFGAGSGAEGVKALAEWALQLVGSHGRRLSRPAVGPPVGHAPFELTVRPLTPTSTSSTTSPARPAQ
jgi:hypothetical protein